MSCLMHSLPILHTEWGCSASWEASVGSRGRALYRRWLPVSGASGPCCAATGAATDPAIVRSVGLLYLWSADSIRKGTSNGLEGALGECRTPCAQLRY